MNFSTYFLILSSKLLVIDLTKLFIIIIQDDISMFVKQIGNVRSEDF